MGFGFGVGQRLTNDGVGELIQFAQLGGGGLTSVFDGGELIRKVRDALNNSDSFLLQADFFR